VAAFLHQSYTLNFVGDNDDIYVSLIWDDAPIWNDRWIQTLNAFLLEQIMKRPPANNHKYHLY
jgi:hypothetical protein